MKKLLIIMALIGVLGRAAQAAPIEVRFDFDARSFGGGPSDSMPFSRVSGSFSVAYDPAVFSVVGDDPPLEFWDGATVTAFSITVQRNPHVPAGPWGDFDKDNVLLEIARSDGPPGSRPVLLWLGGLAPLKSIIGGSNDFILAFEFDAGNPTFGDQAFRGFSYAVSGAGPEVYQTSIGSVQATLVPLPASWAMLAGGLAVLVPWRRSRGC